MKEFARNVGSIVDRINKDTIRTIQLLDAECSAEFAWIPGNTGITGNFSSPIIFSFTDLLILYIPTLGLFSTVKTSHKRNIGFLYNLLLIYLFVTIEYILHLP